MGKEKVRISIVVIGYVDSGKSTTTGHLFHKVGGIDKHVIVRYEEESAEMNKYAWVLGKLKAERERGITIDTSLLEFETDNYYFSVIDMPGHRDFIKNMIIGTCKADCAILIIDSTAGAFEHGMSNHGQTHEHVLLAFTLGVDQMICCCNKMDATTPKYSEERYKEIVHGLSHDLRKVGYKPDKVRFVPISGLEGDNLTERSSNFDWYKGPVLLEALDTLQRPRRICESPRFPSVPGSKSFRLPLVPRFDSFRIPLLPGSNSFRLPLLDVYRTRHAGTVVTGRIEAGFVCCGMRLTFGPAGLVSGPVTSILHNETLVFKVTRGDDVSLSIGDTIAATDLRRGYVASDALSGDPATRVVGFHAYVIILDHPGQIKSGYTPFLKCHTARAAVRFHKILRKINRHSGEIIEDEPKFLQNGDVGFVMMIPTVPMAVESFSDYPSLGRFVIGDMEAVGVIQRVRI
ncbi:hypothetical protein MRB53_000125 [Persea americana]|uniref:Uncharacterized protein n=2 Tax=Persea americana TaxID=3435 RepID=A0ACC2MQD5_PERAE|nr:hypothetical protein MRB53_000114 [Persea americana]KAJ8647102.1 hypothetical protein MRB53_000125 [Persea americana]